MAKRIGGKRGAKQLRVAGKKGKHMMPGMEDMKAGMMAASEIAAMQKKRGFAKKRRRKARKGAY